MNPLPIEIAQVIENTGILVSNYRTVESLRSALSRGENAFQAVPASIEEVIEERAWRDRMSRDGQRFTYDSDADFVRFITDPAPGGLGVSLDEVRRYLGGSDNPIRLAFEELVRKGVGAPEGNQNAAGPRSGNLILDGCNSNRHPITDCFAPPTIPFTPTPSRNYSREAPTGTSVSYALRRLGKDRPDLLEKVKAGELKPKTAMREAGFIAHEFSIPVEPQGAARRILNRFQGEPLVELLRVLANHAGYDLAEK